MALTTVNATCDIYRAGNAPPANPDVSGVRLLLFEQAQEGAEGSEGLAAQRWTHVAYFDLSVDVRHDSTAVWTAGDSVYVPDKNGTGFSVLLVVRTGRGTPNDRKKAFLRLAAWSWPTSEL